MTDEAMRQQMEEFQKELARLDERKTALETILKGYEAYFRSKSQNGNSTQSQLPLLDAVSRNQTKGSMTFREGVTTVLKEARGEPLAIEEIWLRMQRKGVRTEAKKPLNFVDLTLRKIAEAQQVPEMSARTWRWTGTFTTTNPESGESH